MSNPILKDLIEELTSQAIIVSQTNSYQKRKALEKEYYNKLEAFIEDVIGPDTKEVGSIPVSGSQARANRLRAEQRARLKGNK